MKRDLALKTAVWPSGSGSPLSGENSSWISHICAYPGSEALTALYSGLCFQRCLDSK